MLPKSGNITENKYKKYLYHGSTTRIIETVGCTNRIWKPEGRLLKVNLSLNATDKSYSASRKHLPRGTICGTLYVFPFPWRFISFGHTQGNTIMGWTWESFQWKWLKTFIPCVEWRPKPVQSIFKSAHAKKSIKTVAEITKQCLLSESEVRKGQDGQSSSQ